LTAPLGELGAPISFFLKGELFEDVEETYI
jgi:hypothetical protein